MLDVRFPDVSSHGHGCLVAFYGADANNDNDEDDILLRTILLLLSKLYGIVIAIFNIITTVNIKKMCIFIMYMC